MTTQIISHHADNQLFATRQQALNEIKRNNYQVIDTMHTLPCSFDERQRNRFDLNYDDEEAIKCYVISTGYKTEPILLGFFNGYVVRDREAGNVIEYAKDYVAAVNLIAKYEEQDKADGTYTPNFYEIVTHDDYEETPEEAEARKWMENWLNSLDK